MIVRRLGLVLVVALLPSIPSVSIKIAGIRAPGSDGKANVIPGRTSSPSVKPAELAVRLDERCKRRVDVRADMAGAINGRRHFWAEKGAAVFEDLDGELNDHFLGAFLGVLKKRRSADGVLATIAYALETQALALNERHWTLALKACRRAGQWQRALELLDLKEASGFALELLDFNLVIATCATASIVSAEQFRAASALIARLEAAGFAPDVETFEPLLRALNMAGRGEAALELFGEMRRAGIEHTPVTYSHLVCAQQISGDPVACLAAFDAMNMEGVEPDQAAYRAALDASIQSGDEVTIAYTELYAGRAERQASLQQTKAFVCGCSRCVAPPAGDMELDGWACAAASALPTQTTFILPLAQTRVRALSWRERRYDENPVFPDASVLNRDFFRDRTTGGDFC